MKAVFLSNGFRLALAIANSVTAGFHWYNVQTLAALGLAIPAGMIITGALITATAALAWAVAIWRAEP